MFFEVFQERLHRKAYAEIVKSQHTHLLFVIPRNLAWCLHSILSSKSDWFRPLSGSCYVWRVNLSRHFNDKGLNVSFI